MDNVNLLTRLERVSAPPDFERRVIGELGRRRAALPRSRRSLVFRYALAGTAAALLVCFLVLNLALPRKLEMPAVAISRLDDSPNARILVPIIEAMDYTSDIRRAGSEPSTVYILEQISNASDTRIKY